MGHPPKIKQKACVFCCPGPRLAPPLHVTLLCEGVSWVDFNNQALGHHGRRENGERVLTRLGCYGAKRSGTASGLNRQGAVPEPEPAPAGCPGA